MNHMSAPLEHPNLDAVVSTFDLAREPVDLVLRGQNGGLDYGRLRFGVRYRALRAFRANRGGQVRKGEALYVLGYSYSPSDNGLRLYFERADGTNLTLDFEGNAPDTAGVVRMIHDANLNTYFKPVLFDLSRRTSRLMAARAVIEHHLKKVSP